MLTSSAKQKGRRACSELKELYLKFAPDLNPMDCEITPSGCNGADLKKYGDFRKKYPYVEEVKNQEKINIWDALEQAQGHAKGTELTPVLFFKRNKSELMVAMKAEDFLKLTA